VNSCKIVDFKGDLSFASAVHISSSKSAALAPVFKNAFSKRE
jgi:hypothetical protein